MGSLMHDCMPTVAPHVAGMYARPLANSCGILGLYYSLFDSFVFNQLDQNGLPDSLSSVVAGGQARPVVK